MLNRPSFKPHLHLATVPEEGVFVLSGTKQALLRGRLYQLVTPLVDGRSADEICDRLGEQASAAEVYYTLSQLERKGFLAEAFDTAPADAAWWSSQEIDPRIAASRLAQGRVSVHGFGVDCGPLDDLLSASGVRTTADGDGDLAVVAVDHYLREELSALNDAALAGGRPWLLVKPIGDQLWLGPLFRPRITGCWKCLAERLRANRPIESYLHQRQSLAEPLVVDRIGPAASLHVAWGLTANAVASWIVRGELPDFEGKVRSFDLLSWQTTTHHLVKLPYCTACGCGTDGNHEGNGDQKSNGDHGANGDHRHIRPLVLESRKKSFVRDGGHRVVHPNETLERFGHHVSSITGAVSMLQRASPNGDGCMHVYLAGNNLARPHHSLAQLRGDLRNMSAGKGTTDAQAKASGLCEGLERHSGVFRGDEPRRKARLADLGPAGTDLNDCLLFSRKQFQERGAINAKNSPYNFVPLPFDPEAQIEWTPAWSLSRQLVRYLPTAFCYYDYPQFKDKRFCIACSNGCAAGNTVEEAILQGFLELVERDSVALWWYNRVRRPGVDLGSFDEPYLDELAAFLETRRREMCVLDLTADLGIPVFAAWSRRTDAVSEQIVLGFGAHLDARIALLRAVTEMNQMLSYLLRSPPEAAVSDTVNDPETVHWLKTATAENQPYLLPAAGVLSRTASDHATAWSDDVALDIRDCQLRLEKAGLELLVVDQTRPEIGLPVVKVVVPGLRHFWARFAPGRLYDVPVQLGWLDQPLAEEALNPVPMFL
ncbi:MAG TPA: TOMM precursor leader peptide-binding protein [Pirellulales bacterium]|nr:TOMM precursor leader peptide-binding protein [Pirellulales bacterium]